MTPEAIVLIKEIKSIEENVDYDELAFRDGSKKVYYFDKFKALEKLIKDPLIRNMTTDGTEIKQN